MPKSKSAISSPALTFSLEELGQIKAFNQEYDQQQADLKQKQTQGLIASAMKPTYNGVSAAVGAFGASALDAADSLLKTPESAGITLSGAANKMRQLAAEKGINPQLIEGIAAPINAVGEGLKAIGRGVDVGGQHISGLSDLGNATTKPLSEHVASNSDYQGYKQAMNDHENKIIGQGDLSGLKDLTAGQILTAGVSAIPSLAIMAAAPERALLTGGAMGAGGALNDAREYEKKNNIRLSDEQIAPSIAASALVNSVGEKIGIDAALGKTGISQMVANKFGNGIIGRALAGTIGAVGEGGTEIGQTIGENAGKKYSYDPKQSLSEGVLESALGGIGGGGAVGMVHGNAQPSASQATTLDEMLKNPITQPGDIGMPPVDASRFEVGKTVTQPVVPAPSMGSGLIPYTVTDGYVGNDNGAPLRGREAIPQPLNAGQPFVVDPLGNVDQAARPDPAQIEDKSGVLYGDPQGNVADNPQVLDKMASRDRAEDAHIKRRDGALYVMRKLSEKLQGEAENDATYQRAKQAWFDSSQALNEIAATKSPSAPINSPVATKGYAQLEDKSNLLYADQQGNVADNPQVLDKQASLRRSEAGHTQRRDGALYVMGKISEKLGGNAEGDAAYQRAKKTWMESSSALEEIAAIKQSQLEKQAAPAAPVSLTVEPAAAPSAMPEPLPPSSTEREPLALHSSVESSTSAAAPPALTTPSASPVFEHSGFDSDGLTDDISARVKKYQQNLERLGRPPSPTNELEEMAFGEIVRDTLGIRMDNIPQGDMQELVDFAEQHNFSKKYQSDRQILSASKNKLMARSDLRETKDLLDNAVQSGEITQENADARVKRSVHLVKQGDMDGFNDRVLSGITAVSGQHKVSTPLLEEQKGGPLEPPEPLQETTPEVINTEPVTVSEDQPKSEANQARDIILDVAKTMPFAEFGKVEAAAVAAVKEKMGKSPRDMGGVFQGNMMNDPLASLIHEGRQLGRNDAASAIPVAISGSSVAAAAKDSHRGTSHSPERRAKGEQDGYVNALMDVWNKVSPIYQRADEEGKARILSEFERVRDGYTDKVNAYLYAHSKVMSAMITGPARFPTASNLKKSNSADRRAQEANEFLAKGLRRILNASKSPLDATPTGTLALATTNLEKRMAKQETMKAANAEARKQGITPPYEDFTLRNNNAEIRRLKQRAIELAERAKAEVSQKESGQEDVKIIGDMKIVNDHELQRVQIFFEGKPDEETRNILKSSGFKWAPSKSAWQRQNTANGIAAAQSVVDQITGTKNKYSTSAAKNDSDLHQEGEKESQRANPNKDAIKKSGLSAETLQAAIDKANEGMKNAGVTVVQTVEDAEKLASGTTAEELALSRTDGFFNLGTKQIVLIADAIDSVERGLWTMAHEQMHRGLDGTLGKKINHILIGAAEHPGVRRLANAIMRDREWDHADPWLNVLSIEEALAELNAARITGNYDHLIDRYSVAMPFGMQKGLVGTIARAFGRIKAWLAKFSGKPIKSITDEHINDLFRMVDEWTQSGTTPEFDPNSTGIRNSRAPNQAMHDAAAGVQNETTSGMKGKLRELGLKAFRLGLNTVPQFHLVQEFSDVLPSLSDYRKSSELMEGRENSLQAESDKLVKQWQQAQSKHGKAVDSMADVMHMATIWGLDPSFGEPGGLSKPWREAYAKLEQKFSSLPPEVQQLYKNVRDHYGVRSEQMMAALEMRINREITEPNTAAKLIRSMREEFDQRVKDGVYFPLARFGDYVIKGSQGKDHITLRAETLAEAESQVAWLQQRGFDDARWTSDIKSAYQDGGVSLNFVKGVADAINDKLGQNDPTANALLDEINQLFIEHLPNNSARKNYLHRQGTAGFSNDAKRAFARTVSAMARNIGSLEHGDAIREAIGAAGKEANEIEGSQQRAEAAAVVQEMNDREAHFATYKGSTLARTLNHAGFLMAMGGNLSSGLVNTSQVPVLGFPYLAAKYGSAKAATKLLKMLGSELKSFKGKDWFMFDATRNPAVSPAEVQMLRELEKLGKRDMSAMMDLIKASSTASATIGRGEQFLQTATLISGHFQRASELMNRDIMAVATYRLAIESGESVKQAIASAADALDATQFDYSKRNRPTMMNGTGRQILMLFKNYAVNLSYLYGRQMNQALRGDTAESRGKARKFLAWSALMQVAAAGAAGFPVWMPATMAGGFIGKTIAPAEHERAGAFVGGALGFVLMSAMMGGAMADDDEPWDWQMEVRKMARKVAEGFTGDRVAYGKGDGDHSAETVMDLLSKGLPTLIGWDISGRISMQDLWYKDSSKPTANSTEKAKDLVFANTGAVGMLLGKAAQAADFTASGQANKAAEALFPSALTNLSKGIRQAFDGVTTREGLKRPVEFGPWDFISQVAGLRPAGVAREMDRERDITQITASLSERQKAIKQEWRKASEMESGPDRSDALRAVLKQVAAYNEKNPVDRLSTRELNSYLTGITKRQRQLDGGRPGKSRQQAERSLTD